jgi:WD40 repeat protein
LASGSADLTVRLWNADARQPLAEPFTGHANSVSSVAYSPDGHRVASASVDRTVRLWPAQAEPNMLCDKLNANMSRTQWHDWVSADFSYQTLCQGLPITADSSGGP